MFKISMVCFCLQPGDILIVNFTDVGWTPYFPLIGGLVTEIGGLISHGRLCIMSLKYYFRNSLKTSLGY